MSFFGFEQQDLEHEKLNFKSPPAIAEYTWGEEGYDGLGDLLQEGRDELNDETFGGDLAVGKDFDFSAPALPGHIRPVQEPKSQPLAQERLPQVDHSVSYKPSQPSQPSQATISLESIWDDRSPFSVLPRSNGSGRSTVNELRREPPAISRFSPFDGGHSPTPAQQLPVHGTAKSGVRIRSLQEVEAELQAAAQQARQRQLEQQHQQLLIQQQEQETLHMLQLQRERERQLLLQQEREREFERQQILQYQEQQLQLQRLQQQQQREQLLQHQRTPPPRMFPGASPSPRFFETQRQILLLQQQHEQQQRLQELQEQLRYEEMERQMRARQNHSPNQFAHRRLPSSATPADLQAHLLLQQQQLQQQQNRRQRSQSPAVGNHLHPLQENLQYLPQNVQSQQQRLLAELGQADIMREMHASSPAEQEALRNEAMRKIVEAERMEEKRRKKAAKIAHMARTYPSCLSFQAFLT
ncbi:hypothetical protein H0H92_012786 [Tricholoma furcatifolium]|nr:hypothetical protein H0H92_012786 [Tricholoma furcatifolium]